MFAVSPLLLGVLVVCLFGFFVESFLLWKALSHYRHLVQGHSQTDLMSLLENMQKTLASHEQTLRTHTTEFKSISDQAQTHLQRLILKRFNPFHNTGGDQSFILGLLDGHQDGIVLTSLHSRENTRFYVKSVKGGIGDPHPLSSEEQQILKKG